jgi:glyoxylase-like metal-dependent hydrolase (beta-lactamase superfamily II)
MLRLITHDDVTQLLCSTRTSRSLDYEVSAFAVRGVLVDTAFPDVRSEIERWTAENRPQGALVTHAHEDHAGNVGSLVARGIPIGMAPKTAARLRDPAPTGWYRRICWGVAPALARPVEAFTHPSLELLAAPGHSADHHVVWDAERETVFGGDLFIGVKVRVAHPGEDIRGHVRSLRAIAGLAPRRFFDAHRGVLANPVDALRAKADWMEEMIGAIEDRGRQGWSDRAIRDAVLGREDLTGWISGGDYSRLNFVQSVLAGIGAAESPGVNSATL